MKRLLLPLCLLPSLALRAPASDAETIGDRLRAHLEQAKAADIFPLCERYGVGDLYVLCALEAVHALELAQARAQCAPNPFLKKGPTQ